jgi:ParB/RepB/Spo0J family partition protein
VNLEFHQIDLRYENLRKRSPRQERQLLASLSEAGQLTPVVVVAASEERYVIVDGYKRVRALKRLTADMVRAMLWDVEESEALVVERLMRKSETDGPLEQGWLLRELRDRFSLSLDDLARRFDKSQSWVSRRLGLAEELPGEIQEHVRAGRICAHAAMKHLLPLARANKQAAVELAAAIAPEQPSSRQVAELYAGWVSGGKETRALILSDPWMYLRASEEAQRADDPERSPAREFIEDLSTLAGVARRACGRLRRPGFAGRLVPPEREEVRLCGEEARSEVETLFRRFDKEVANAGPEHTDSGTGASCPGTG